VDADAQIEQRRLSFGPAADLYDAARPSYPAEAVRWMLGEAPCRVVDLGAGTGIFSRLLASLGHDVVAVEPDEGMRNKLAARSPALTTLAGSAEAIPLPDGSVDAVTAAQSHHWFDNETAHAAIARVLRAGGVFAAIWNVRDESVPWVKELSQLLDRRDTLAHREGRKNFGPLFAAPEQTEFSHRVEYTAETLVSLARSRSRYLVATEHEQREIIAAVRALTERLPERFELPYITVAVRAVRRSA
jgi:SAM-dependent methyltransferase